MELKISDHLNPNLTSFWNEKGDNLQDLVPTRARVLYGGRSSSKSHEICTMLIIQSLLSKKKILCTRAFQNKISDSVMALLIDKIEKLGVGSLFKILKNRIFCTYSGSEFLFYGLARNTAEVKGLEGVDICYIEEAQYITKEMFMLLSPTVRKEGSEIWIAFNPLGYFDFIYQKYVINPPSNARVQLVNYTDNPFLSNTMIDEIDTYRNEDDFSHVYLGEVQDSSNQSIIKLHWLETAVDAFTKLGITLERRIAKNVIGFDIMDAGDDLNALVIQEGNEVTKIEEWKTNENEMDISCNKLVRLSVPLNAIINYDGIGVGAGAGSFFKIHKARNSSVKFKSFVASAKVENPKSYYRQMGTATQIKNEDAFLNLKAQKWIQFADKLKTTYNAIENGTDYNIKDIVSFSSKISETNINKMFRELVSPQRELVGDKKIKVESKQSLSKRGIPSHNIADAVIMAFSEKQNAF